MKRLWLTLLFVSMPALAQPAPVQTSLETYYHQLAGHWLGAAENVDLTYAVKGDTVAVQGEECSSEEPIVCGVIDQAYKWKTDALLRNYENFGTQPVEVVELTAHKMVKREVHPMVPDRVSVTTEELLDADTLMVTAELWSVGENEPRARREYTLKRADVVSSLTQ